MYGWIGGSCAQPTVVREALAALREDTSRLIRLSPDPGAQAPREGLLDVPMTCYSGGTLEIFIEPQQPRPRLLIVGGLPVARALAQLGRAMSYHVVVVDPARAGEPPPEADELLADVAALPARVNPLSFAVVATHGEYDEPALEELLRAGAPYVALVASRTRAAAVREYLAERGLSVAQLAALHAPAGLDIGARRGDEIALSIMAEIVQRRRSAERIDWGAGEEAAPAAPPARAIDPVCGMEVEIAGARHTFEHGGVTYYFCCPGCLATFRKQKQG
jgi:xanthine dehydrogenase accessory factor